MPGSTRAFATTETLGRAAGRRRPVRLMAAFTTAGGAAGLLLTLVFFTIAGLADVMAPTDPFASVGRPLSPPSRLHILGTDDLGRDLLAGVAHGARTSLLVVLSATLLASTIGVVVGSLAGYRPGTVDDLLMRATEIVLVVPRFFLAVVVIALFGPGLDRMILVLGLTSWPVIARVVRAQTLSLARRDFVDAARGLGASEARIVIRHVLPNAVPAAFVVISVSAASVILLEAGLGFLGLGDPRLMSWGYLMNNAQRFLRVAWWLALFPGSAIALAVLGLNLLGDAVNDFLDPHTRRTPEA
jgi:peptide/nickel transport system permease protein